MQQSTPTIMLNSMIQRNFSVKIEDTPIIDCIFINSDYIKSDDRICFNSVRQVWDPDYGICFKMRANNSEHQQIRAVSALVYVNTSLQYTYATEYDLNIKNSQATGLRVLVHAPGTQPDMTFGTDVGIGLATTMVLDQTNLVQLPTPYTHCTTQQTLGLVDESTPYT